MASHDVHPDPWTTGPSELLRDLSTRDDGLTDDEAAARLDPAVAALTREHRHPLGVLVRRHVTSGMALIQMTAALLSAFVGSWSDTVLISGVLTLSVLLSLRQEYRAHAVMTALHARLRIHADVVRDGVEREVPVPEIVVGDIVIVRSGDIAPADVRLLESHALVMDEASITGESMPVEKSAEATTSGGALLPESGVFLGSHVVSGSARGVVVAVGPHTRFGALVSRMEGREATTHFEAQIRQFGLLLARVLGVLVIAILAISLTRGESLTTSLLFTLALALGITPQLLPAIVVMSLSAGARRMARRHVLVKRLDAIEDIGLMTLLCCDKTGTLTRGRPEFVAAVDPRGEPSDQVGMWAGINAAHQRGYANVIDEQILASVTLPTLPTLLDEVPYDFHRRMVSVLVDIDGGLLIAKGAPESVLERCHRVRTPDGMAGLAEHWPSVMDLLATWGEQGIRVLAVASTAVPGRTQATRDDEHGLTLDGFVLLADPPTVEARAAIAELGSLDVDVALVTGDDHHVAASVARAVGLPAERILSGEQIAQLDDLALREACRETRVFTRVDPEGKERVVRAMQASGHAVGFLGDGINDAAGIRVADVGISVQGAADVTRQVASMVLLDKDLASVAAGVREGRRTVANTLKYIRVTISANFGNVVSLVIASAFLPFLPLLPVQVLLLNLLSDIPAIALSDDTIDAEQEATPRTWSNSDIRRFMIAFGFISTAFDLACFLVLFLLSEGAPAAFHTGWFLLSLTTEMVALLVLRSQRPIWRTRPGGMLITMIVVVLSATLALVLSPVAPVVGLTSLPTLVLVSLLALALAYLMTNEIAKVWWLRSARLPWA